MLKKNLYNHDHKWFTTLNPKNSFIIDYSNGAPVIITTNVTKNTSWRDIFKGNYDYANPDGTPGYLLINGEKYTYIDYKYTKFIGVDMYVDSSVNIGKYISKVDQFIKRCIP